MAPEENTAPDISSAVVEVKTEAVAPARDEFDPLGWELPLFCKDCGKQFKVPYRHFQAGVVFHCPHCHGSFVPKTEMCRAVRDAFENFYGRQKRRREERGDGATPSIEPNEMLEFQAELERLAREMHPAGKMIRRRGLRAMFS